MNTYEKLLDVCKTCDNCWSSNQLEIHHKVFRSEESWLQGFIDSKKELFKESYWIVLEDYWINDIQNLVVLCAYCHKERIHSWDYELRNYYRNRITKDYFQIPFEKAIDKLY